MKWEEIEKWDFIVGHVASEYSRKYRMVEIEDLRQSLYEWFAEHPNKLKEWQEQGDKNMKNLLYRSLRNQALDYCQREKAQALGYEVEDLFYYEPDVVEALLPAVLRGDYEITAKLNLGRPGKPSAPSEGFNIQAMMIEIESAYRKLNEEDMKLLFLRYANSMEYPEIANELQIASPDAVRMRILRAIRKLVNRMGGIKPYLERDTGEEVNELPDHIEEPDQSYDGEDGDDDGS